MVSRLGQHLVQMNLPLTSTSPKLRMSGVLSNAASAASAAAEAAGAAASAARTAAVAASTAVEAINAILPPSQRVAIPQQSRHRSPLLWLMVRQPATVLVETRNQKPKRRRQKIPTVTVLAENGSDRSVGAFGIPSEQSLAGLVGTVEIPVSVNRFSGLVLVLAGRNRLKRAVGQ